MAAACASIRCECRSPPIGLAAISPSLRNLAYQRIALALATPNRSAACPHEAPASMAAITRSRRSRDKARAIMPSVIRTPWNHNGSLPATSADSARKAAALMSAALSRSFSLDERPLRSIGDNLRNDSDGRTAAANPRRGTSASEQQESAPNDRNGSTPANPCHRPRRKSPKFCDTPPGRLRVEARSCRKTLSQNKFVVR